jgi:hypothetical protein
MIKNDFDPETDFDFPYQNILSYDYYSDASLSPFSAPNVNENFGIDDI